MARQPKRFEVRYTVRGYGAFPTDMLRYDRSEAATPEDVEWMKGREERELMLKTWVEDPKSHVRRLIREGRVPCKDRWRSFGWEVTEVYEPTDISEDPAVAAEIRKRTSAVNRELRRLLKGS